MTGDTFVNDVEKGPQSPTDTERTVGGDAIIEMGEELEVSSHRSSSDTHSRSSVNDASAQPRKSHITTILVSEAENRYANWNMHRICKKAANIFTTSDWLIQV